MSRALSSLLALLLLLAAALPVAADEAKPAPPPDTDVPLVVHETGEVVPGEVIVKFRDEDKAGEVARARGLEIAASVGAAGHGLPAVATTRGRPVEQVLAELRTDPSVEYAEPSYLVQVVDDGAVAAVSVNDPMTAGQYSLDRMRVRDAWSLSKGGSGVVAVLDTGVQPDHPDLSGRVLPGRDFVNNDSNAADDNGHGTWVAGIIAAKPNDGWGMAGISWSDKILPVKIMNSSGTGSTSALISGIIWAADNGAKVINMSVGGFPYSQAVQDAATYAWNKGAVLVGAAGNNNREERFYPASLNHVISVSATQPQDEFSHWSSYGPAVDVSAPGSSVLTTNCTASICPHREWGSHTYISGTSFATPNVAGVVALIRARNPTWTPQQVVDRLYATVDDLGYAGWDNRYGRGRVNAYRALGASVAASPRPAGDGLETNNTLGAARVIPLGTATRPTIYPASDVDVFAVDVPRAGRLDVRVSGVVDARDWTWRQSSLPIDPIVELYTTGGTLLKRVDAVWQDGVELAQTSVSGPTRILVRVTNYFANGSRTAYSITPTYVDTAAPALSGRSPAPGALRVNYEAPAVVATFNEPVTGVSGSTFVLKSSAGTAIPSTVTYDASARRATLKPSVHLAGEATYTAILTSGIKDPTGNAMATTSWTFTTGKTAPRIWGADRYATATALSASAFKAGVPIVYIATGGTFPDALAGGPAARIKGGPILLTLSGSIPDATRAELTRLKPAQIVVLGGPSAIADRVVTDLRAYTAGTVSRVWGADRYATAAAISAATFTSSSVAYVATGENFPDALGAGAVAAARKAPLLLVRAGGIPAETTAELARLKPSTIVIVGSTGAVSNGVAAALAAHGTVTRISGADRYASTAALSAASFPANGPGTVYVATGKVFPDGLTAGPIAGLRNGPLLLVPGTSLPSSVAAELRRLDPTNVVIVGGPEAITDSVRNQIRALWP
ncbi:S8 family serine peptidase [Microbacterium sp.]|uniref:S8 family serine peptidase n=1 Tax=Microbacterium sp. TaxID=51671 RepID=UPI0031FEA0E5|nr:S8 family serine peptidase [Microbacterium sp.]